MKLKNIFLLLLLACISVTVQAQPQARRDRQVSAHSNADNLTTRARIQFPTMAPMSEDVVWRRDIYRQLDLTQDANAGLYYPTEPLGNQMNLFTYIFKLMMTGNIRVYAYRLDGTESFEDSARVKPMDFLNNYHIFYERVNGRVRIDNSDIPSREVKSYYIKESAYYDQATATFHTKVLALCPIMEREDDFGDGVAKYPLFWVKYDDLAPFLAKQQIMTSNLNNAATMSLDDYFTMNMYRGKIYKTTNMLGRTLAQYCPNDSSLSKEQQCIENELQQFESHIWGDKARKDSLDSVAHTADSVKKVKKTNRRSGDTASVRNRRATSHTVSAGASPRVTVRRERH